jgi:RHS repeat-associated protein
MVAGGPVAAAQAALIRGRVLGLPEGAPLAGVTVSILGHPEYNPSITGPDGTYAVAVNGGAQVIVSYAGPVGGETTYLPVQRHTPTRWQDYAAIPDVYLTPLDPNATDITLGSGTWQAAAGSTITDPADQNGVPGGPPVSPTLPHTARVFFPADTTANFIYGGCGNTAGSCGATCSQGTCTAGECTGVATPALTVRLTEYTVGATGKAAMPAELPPSTAYTYALELSADEAIAKGATGVSFNQPVVLYVDDFLGFGAAQSSIVNPPVPVAFYNRATGEWVPSSNGQIIEISGFTGTCPGTGCVASLRSGATDGGAPLSLSSDELAFLGQTYGSRTAPVYLWRVPTNHFTGGDLNWPFTPPDGPSPPPDPDCPDCPDIPNTCDQLSGGSIIECENAILAQQITIPGTPFFLRYQSERAPGRVPTISIQLTDASWPPTAPEVMPLNVTVEIDLAGNTYTMSYPPSSLTPSQFVQWTWDQKDAFGNTIEGQQLATVTVSYIYAGVYTGVPSDTPITFNSVSSTGSIIGSVLVRALNQVARTTVAQVWIGVEDAAPLGLGGWTISPHHVYDPRSYSFWGGDGNRRFPHSPVIQSVPGVTGLQGIVPAVSPSGALYETQGVVLESVSSTGTLTPVAGAGTLLGSYPACTPALSAQFPTDIVSLATTPAGTIYVGDSTAVHLVDPIGNTIQTVAGQVLSNGNSVEGCQDATVGAQGTLGSPQGLAVSPDGSVYIADVGCNSLRRILPNGSLVTVSSSSASCEPVLSWNPGQLLSTACIGQPTAVAVAPDGTIYLAENAPFSRIDRIDAKTTVISTYAGIRSGPTGQSPTVNDGKAAIGVHFAGFIGGLTVGGDGTLYLTDPGGPALYSIDPMGIMHLIAGGAPAGAVTEVDNVPASETLIAIPMSLAIDSIGDVFMFDYGTSSNPARVREIVSPFPRYAGGTTVIPSTDGTELYQFSPLGQHLATLDPVTGATLRTFQYDGQNRLTSVTETRGGTTRLSYNGDTVTITPPFSAGGQQTVLTLDQAGGHTTAITTPAGETTQLAYSNGLMTSLIDPRLGVHSYAYDSLGRLTSDTDPANATTGVVVTNDFTPVSPDGGVLPGVSWSSAVTSPVGHVTTHQDLQLSNGTRERNIIAPSGATRLSSESSGELWTTVAPDGTTTLSQQTADPQFGMLDPYVSALTRTTPSGLTYKSTRNRTSTGSALAPSSITDLLTVNGQTEAWEQLFAAAAGPSAAHWLFTSPAGRQRLQTLDALGRVTSISFPGTRTLPTTTFVYDADGRVSSVTVTPNGGGVPRVTTNTYDTYLAGYLATSQDPAADVTTYDQRDQDGRVLDVELPDFSMQPLSHVGTTYDPNGNVTSVTVPPATSLPSTHSFTNTPVDLLESYTPPQVSSTTTGNDPELATLTTSYTYNGDRQLTKESVPEGTGFQTVMTDYDGFGRLSATYDPLSNVTASYQYVLNAAGVSTDQVGSVVTSDGVSLTNTYDGFLKTRASWASSSVNGSVSWTYDTFFRPSTLQVSGAAPVAFSYDLDSLYVGTSSPSFGVTRDQSGSSLDGLPYSSVLGTVSDAWTYDGFGAQSSYTVKTSDGTVLYAMYGSGGIGSPITRDSLGRITLMNETINGATHSWLMTYDSRSRLESVTLDGGTNVYTYDPNGNLTEINGATFGTYDAQDRMVTLNPANGSGPWTYSYTNNGDLTEKTSGTQEYAFDYDLSSNLRSAQVNTSITADVSYVIDGSNRRVGKAITPSIGASVADGLLYDEQNRVVGELGASGSVLSTFVYGLKPNVPDYMVNGGTTYRIISDWRGDVRLVLNTTETGTAAVVQRLDYDAWGNVTNLVDPDCSVGGTALCWQPFGFGGGLWEPATGIVRFGARDYDPMAGRFVQKDPVRLAGGQNVFLYANDDPINGSDPSGEWPKWIPAPSVLKCDGWYVQCLNPPQPPSPTPPDSNPDMCMEVPAPNNNPNKDWCQYCFTVCVQRAGFWEATWPTDIPACKY